MAKRHKRIWKVKVILQCLFSWNQLCISCYINFEELKAKSTSWIRIQSVSSKFDEITGLDEMWGIFLVVWVDFFEQRWLPPHFCSPFLLLFLESIFCCGLVLPRAWAFFFPPSRTLSPSSTEVTPPEVPEFKEFSTLCIGCYSSTHPLSLSVP